MISVVDLDNPQIGPRADRGAVVLYGVLLDDDAGKLFMINHSVAILARHPIELRYAKIQVSAYS